MLAQVRMWDIRTSGCVRAFDQHNTSTSQPQCGPRQPALFPLLIPLEPRLALKAQARTGIGTQLSGYGAGIICMHVPLGAWQGSR